MSYTITQANKLHLDQVSRLFDLYRQFYECEPDLELARNYISARMDNKESTIFIALDDNKGLGFVQLYPSFCSVEAIKIQVLYDLYVDQDARKTGIGEALMSRASEYARHSDAQRVDLSTAHSNSIGQHLYEKLGYRIVDEDFYSYSLYL